MADAIETGLANRVVLVTGANNPYGIGAGAVKAFAGLGAKVFLHYYRQFPKDAAADRVGASHKPGEAFYRAQQAKSPKEVLRSIEGSGDLVRTWEADLSDPASIPALFDKAEQMLGPVEVLVNNAAHWQGDTFAPAGENLPNKLYQTWTAPPGSMDAGSIDRHFSINTRAVALAMAEFAERHVRRGAAWGRIINISTDGAYCFPSEASYGASKLALESYTRSAATELGQFGITVNAVSLGPVQTGWITTELEKRLLPRIPLGRIGSATDVADVIVFLASNQARWVTGQRIHVGGGSTM